MNESTAHFSKTLDDFKQQLAAKLTEARKILAVINALEETLGLPKTAPSELAAGVSIQDPVAPPKPAENSIRPDEYLGESPLDAARKFLRRVHRAVHLDVIADAIRRGGAAATGANWKEQLEASLLRSTRDVVKVQEGIYGLTEFYTEQQLKGLRQTRRQRPKEEGKKPRKRKLKSKRRVKKPDQEPKGDQQETG